MLNSISKFGETRPEQEWSNGTEFSGYSDFAEKRVHSKRIPKFSKTFPGIFTVPFRAQLYGLGYPRQPSPPPPPRAILAEVTFSLFLSKIQPAVYIRIANSSRGARQLGWASCLTSAGRVTLASGTTFVHINALARLTGTTLGVASVT